MSELFPAELETERLRFERLCRETVNVLELYEACSGSEMAEVTRYMPWEPHETPKETAEYLDRVEERWEDDEAAAYLIRPREGEDGTGEIAGLGTLHAEWERRVGGLGTWFRKRFWGRGYSGERAAAMMELAFERLDLELVEVTHHVDNEKSHRAIEKYVERFGGQRDGVLRNWIPYGDEVADEVRYTITREQWAANR